MTIDGISLSEIQKYQKLAKLVADNDLNLAKADTNGDNVITQDELKIFLNDKHKLAISDDQIAVMAIPAGSGVAADNADIAKAIANADQQPDKASDLLGQAIKTAPSLSKNDLLALADAAQRHGAAPGIVDFIQNLAKMSDAARDYAVKVCQAVLNGDQAAVKENFAKAQQAAVTPADKAVLTELTTSINIAPPAPQQAADPGYLTPSKTTLKDLSGNYDGSAINLPDNLLPPDIKNDPGYATLKAYAEYRNKWRADPDGHHRRDELEPFTLQQFTHDHQLPKVSRSDDRHTPAYEKAKERVDNDIKAALALQAKLDDYRSKFKVYDSDPKVDPLGLVKKVVPPNGEPFYVIHNGTHKGNATIWVKGWANNYASLDPMGGADNAAYRQARETAGQKAYDSWPQKKHGEIVGPRSPQEARELELRKWPLDKDPSGSHNASHWNLSKGDWSCNGGGGNIVMTSDPLKTVDRKGKTGIYDVVPDPEKSWFDKLLPALAIGAFTWGIGTAVSGALAGSGIIGDIAVATGLSETTVTAVGTQAVVGGFKAGITGGNVLEGMAMGGASAGLSSVAGAVGSLINDGTDLGNIAANAAKGIVASVGKAAVSGGGIGAAALSGAAGDINALVSGVLGTDNQALTNIVTSGLTAALKGGDIGAAVLNGAAGNINALVSGVLGTDNQALTKVVTSGLTAALKGGDIGAAVLNGAAGDINALVNGVLGTDNQALTNIVTSGLTAAVSGKDVGQAVVTSGVNALTESIKPST